MCNMYFYTGILIGVNKEFIKIENAYIIYDTGPLKNKEWKDFEKLPHNTWNIMRSSIESFGILE